MPCDCLYCNKDTSNIQKFTHYGIAMVWYGGKNSYVEFRYEFDHDSIYPLAVFSVCLFDSSTQDGQKTISSIIGNFCRVLTMLNIDNEGNSKCDLCEKTIPAIKMHLDKTGDFIVQKCPDCTGSKQIEEKKE
jgi:hypothetical protein